MDTAWADCAFTIETDRGPIEVAVDFGSGDSVMLAFGGAITASSFEGYDGHYDCIWRHGVAPWEAAGIVARLAQSKGLRPTSIAAKAGA
jgi:hypothetical protein